MIKQLLFLPIMLLCLVSCKKQVAEKEVFYFGGIIEHPKSKFVVLKKGEKVIDTLYLDKKNSFLKKFDELKEGLYSFNHGSEMQYVYLQNLDSVIVSLNTMDFDESLVFSGNGFEKNEYLVNLFLQNEHENKSLNNTYHLSPEAFKKKTMFLRKQKLNQFKRFEEEQGVLSEGFKKIALASINYPIYKKLEYYPIAHQKLKNNPDALVLEDDYYDFREDVNVNDSSLLGYYAYTNYVITYLHNKTFCNSAEDAISKCDSSVSFFKTVDENIQIESFKNRLLIGNVLHNLLKNSESEEVYVLELFLKFSTDDEDKKQVLKLISDKKRLVDGQPFVDFDLKNNLGEVLSLKDLIENKVAVVCFWSKQYMSEMYISKRIRFLKSQYPQIEFVCINTDESYSNKNKRKFQYKLTSTGEGQFLNTSKLPRTLLISKKGITINSYANITSKEFNGLLEESEK